MIHRRTHLFIIAILVLSTQLPAQAGILFDFEQPYFVENLGVSVKDHCLVEDEGIYHVFFIQSFPPIEGGLREEKWLGHITSPDLRHWTRQDSILPVVPDSWEEEFIWAPDIVEKIEGDGWFIFYTGANEFVTQQTGGAKSADLYDWEKFPHNAIYHPGNWAYWDEDNEFWPWSNCRDPEIFHMEGEREYWMLNTARMADLTGAVSLAMSMDLVHWTDAGPFYIHENENMIESVQLIEDNEGWFHFFFTEEGITGTTHLLSDEPFSGWDLSERSTIDMGHGAEITKLSDKTIFSRFNGLVTTDAIVYFIRFDEILLETEDHIPEIQRLDGLQDWWHIYIGTAFGNQPTWGDNPYQRNDPASHMEGNSYIATYEDYPEPAEEGLGGFAGNGTWGVLKSDPFVLTEDRISLLVGGGNLPDVCFVALVDQATETVLFNETGTHSHEMTLRLWDTSTLIGSEVYVAIADLSTGDWGHIAVDTVKEYTKIGVDPTPPSDPLVDGPLLLDLLIDAGYDPTAIAENDMPSVGRLLSPYPNPFNPSTRISFELVHEAEIELRIVDVQGRSVRLLDEGHQPAGRWEMVWDGRDDSGQALSSGVYFVSLSVEGEFADSRKLVLVK
jgi:hypothetical protein